MNPVCVMVGVVPGHVSVTLKFSVALRSSGLVVVEKLLPIIGQPLFWNAAVAAATFEPEANGPLPDGMVRAGTVTNGLEPTTNENTQPFNTRPKSRAIALHGKASRNPMMRKLYPAGSCPGRSMFVSARVLAAAAAPKLPTPWPTGFWKNVRIDVPVTTDTVSYRGSTMTS